LFHYSVSFIIIFAIIATIAVVEYLPFSISVLPPQYELVSRDVLPFDFDFPRTDRLVSFVDKIIGIATIETFVQKQSQSKSTFLPEEALV
jgi:hypothetical protein